MLTRLTIRNFQRFGDVSRTTSGTRARIASSPSGSLMARWVILVWTPCDTICVDEHQKS